MTHKSPGFPACEFSIFYIQPDQMNCRAWTRAVLWVVPSVSVAVAAYFLTPEIGVDPLRNYRLRRIAKKLHINLPPPTPLTAAELAEAKANAAAWKAKFLIEFPALQVPEHPVPDEENGFRLLYELGDHLPMSTEFWEALSDIPACDLEIAKRCLAEHPELVARVERIASLQTRSSAGMPRDYAGVFPMQSVRQCLGILLLKARLAAVAGDELETLRYVSAAGNLADHFHAIETPSILSASNCLTMNSQRQQLTFSTLLPTLGKTADLEQWKAALCRRDYSPAEFGKVLRGEWHMGADFMAFPLIALNEKLGEVPDAEAVLRLHTSWTNELVAKLPSLGWADAEPMLSLPPQVSLLSDNGRAILELFNSGLKACAHGYVWEAVANAQTKAAMDLLILEKSGVQLTATDTSRITRDPVTGQPFVFDPAKRELTAPTNSFDVEPLVLPW